MTTRFTGILTMLIAVYLTGCLNQTYNTDTPDNDNKYAQYITDGVADKSEHVTIPEFERTDTNVQIIETEADFRNTINDPDKNIFLIKPGIDYTPSPYYPYNPSNNQRVAGNENSPIEITASGTAGQRRYILLDNGNETPPAALPKTQLARYRLKMINANYWYIDRMAYWKEINPWGKMLVLINSSNNVIHMPLLEDTQTGIDLRDNSSNNIIQFMRAQKTQWSVDERVLYDAAAVQTTHDVDIEDSINNKLVHSELMNYVDGFQVVRGYGAYTPSAQINAEGTLIWDNDIYITSMLYTNGDGVQDANGNRAFAENAIDLKTGSLNPSNPIVIRHNRLWGYRSADNTYSHLSDTGNAIVAHYDVGYIEFEDNMIFDSEYGMVAGSPLGDGRPLRDSMIRNNVIHDIGSCAIAFTGSLNADLGIYDSATNVTVDNNFFAKTGDNVYRIYNANGLTIENNTFADSPDMYFADFAYFPKHTSNDVTVTDNIFYNMTGTVPSYATASGNTVLTQEVDYSLYIVPFTTDTLTAAPRLISP